MKIRLCLSKAFVSIQVKLQTRDINCGTSGTLQSRPKSQIWTQIQIEGT